MKFSKYQMKDYGPFLINIPLLSFICGWPTKIVCAIHNKCKQQY